METPGFSRLKLLFALSRTPHGLIDMATPALSALLCLGELPPAKIILLGLLTAFAGYTAVYALNDIADYRTDSRKSREGRLTAGTDDLDSVFVRHPLAQGMLSYRSGLIWAGWWSFVALIGAFLLHPLCAVIFAIGCLLEFLYCRLLQVSFWRTAISGIVKTLGGIAAVIAVDPHPSWIFLAVLFCWLFTWEIGGQNIPNDWTDADEDHALSARTIPIQLGTRSSVVIIMASLSMTALFNMLLYMIAPIRMHFFMLPATVFVLAYLLFWPACRLLMGKTRLQAAALFNRASYYPLSILLILLISFSI